MKRFFITNKTISIIFLITVSLIFTYVFYSNKITFVKAQWLINLFDLIYQISVGYVISFIFYVMQVYIPRRQQDKIAYKALKNRLNDTTRQMRDIFSHIVPKYIDSYGSIDDLSNEQLLLTLQKLNIDERLTGVAKASLWGTSEQYYTIREWINAKLGEVTREIDKIFNYYTSYINPELTIILEKILKSSMHKSFPVLLQNPNGVTFAEAKDDPFLTPYYELMRELINFTNKID